MVVQAGLETTQPAEVKRANSILQLENNVNRQVNKELLEYIDFLAESIDECITKNVVQPTEASENYKNLIETDPHRAKEALRLACSVYRETMLRKIQILKTMCM